MLRFLKKQYLIKGLLFNLKVYDYDFKNYFDL